jgi:quercetin dioxygenase-like cupin family protein
MTLLELSNSSGVALATLSRIENERMTGTIESHMAIAKALGMPLAELYADIEAETREIDLQKKPERSDIFVHSDKSSYEMLTRNVLNKKMMPIMLKIVPGGKSNPETNSVGTEKFIYVLEGKIEVTAGDKTYPLNKSDTLYFDSSLKHQFKNIGKNLARAICVITPPAL